MCATVRINCSQLQRKATAKTMCCSQRPAASSMYLQTCVHIFVRASPKKLHCWRSLYFSMTARPSFSRSRRCALDACRRRAQHVSSLDGNALHRMQDSMSSLQHTIAQSAHHACAAKASMSCQPSGQSNIQRRLCDACCCCIHACSLTQLHAKLYC